MLTVGDKDEVYAVPILIGLGNLRTTFSFFEHVFSYQVKNSSWDFHQEKIVPKHSEITQKMYMRGVFRMYFSTLTLTLTLGL